MALGLALGDILRVALWLRVPLVLDVIETLAVCVRLGDSETLAVSEPDRVWLWLGDDDCVPVCELDIERVCVAVTDWLDVSVTLGDWETLGVAVRLEDHDRLAVCVSEAVEVGETVPLSLKVCDWLLLEVCDAVLERLEVAEALAVSVKEGVNDCVRVPELLGEELWLPDCVSVADTV